MTARIFSRGGLDLADVSLNALRAFEAAARHGSFTRAGVELSVTQAAVSHQVKALEGRLGVPLFRRTARGLLLTDEGQALLPTLSDAFTRMAELLARFERGRMRRPLTVSVVGTFYLGWLLPRLDDFHAAHPDIDLRLLTNNNRVDLAGESLDLAIRYGNGDWPGAHAAPLLPAPLAPLCTPAIASRLREPADLAGEVLLRSYRVDDWPCWFAAAGIEGIAARGPLFDSSLTMVAAARRGAGVALAPPAMFATEFAEGALVRPFATLADAGAYWLVRSRSRPSDTAVDHFATWLGEQAGNKLLQRTIIS